MVLGGDDGVGGWGSRFRADVEIRNVKVDDKEYYSCVNNAQGGVRGVRPNARGALVGNLRAAQVTLGEQTDSDQALVPSDEHKGAQRTEQKQTERASQRVDCKMDELKKIRYMGDESYIQAVAVRELDDEDGAACG